jgi:signal peptidase I
MDNNENKPTPFLREMLVTTVKTAVLTLLFIYFIAQTSVVYGKSMEPVLHTDQRLIIEKVSYHFEQPQRGNIVVVDVPDSDIPLIKRVIGLPGETLEIKQNQVYIDGVALTEPYLESSRQHNFGPIPIPDNHLFVMGDNRLVSRDSRAFGAVSLDQIRGRAWVSYWPMQDIGIFDQGE